MRKTLCSKLLMKKARRSIIYQVHMYNGNIQKHPLCVEPCVTKEFPVSPRFSPAFFIAMQFHYSYEHVICEHHAPGAFLLFSVRTLPSF